ncbi:MAG: hypothetical protein ACI8TF_002358, partial [Paracoccaceae bacterium]
STLAVNSISTRCQRQRSGSTQKKVASRKIHHIGIHLFFDASKRALSAAENVSLLLALCHASRASLRRVFANNCGL